MEYEPPSCLEARRHIERFYRHFTVLSVDFYGYWVDSVKQAEDRVQIQIRAMTLGMETLQLLLIVFLR